MANALCDDWAVHFGRVSYDIAPAKTIYIFSRLCAANHGFAMGATPDYIRGVWRGAGD